VGRNRCGERRRHRPGRRSGMRAGMPELEVLETLDAAGVAFRSATEPFDTTSAAGRMMVQMLGVIRVRAGHHHRPGDRRDGALVPPKAVGAADTSLRLPSGQRGGIPRRGRNRSAADPVIFDLYANKPLGAHAIAKWLWGGRSSHPRRQAVVVQGHLDRVAATAPTSAKSAEHAAPTSR
jgi:hypothetical protein